MKDKILWFVPGAPTADQKKLAQAEGYTLRNSQMVTASDFVEQCTFCCGDVPPKYAERYPVVEAPDGVASQPEPAPEVAAAPPVRKRR